MKLRLPGYLTLISLFMGGCSFHPKAAAPTQISDFASSIQKAASDTQVPANATLDINEALARAIAYNQDIRAEEYGIALTRAQMLVQSADMLPSVIADSNYYARNSKALSRGSTSNVAAYSADPTGINKDITLTWNILDFGLSYIRAQQAGDKAMIQMEQRRKVVSQIIEETRVTFWRAKSLQNLIERMGELKGQVKQQLDLAETQSRDSALDPSAALTYERDLLSVQRELDSLQQSLVGANEQLRQLINAPPGEVLHLSANRESFDETLLRMNGETAIKTALQHRYEIRQALYEIRITDKEVMAALLQLLPGISTNLGGLTDTNSFLTNSNWISWGAKASWNLMEIFKFPVKKLSIDAQQQMNQRKAMAMAIAISTQVSVARARYALQMNSYKSASQYASVQRRLTVQTGVSAKFGRVGEQSMLRERMSDLVAQTKLDFAYADLQNAYASYVSALGLDALDYGRMANLPPEQIASFLQQTQSEGKQSISRLTAPTPVACGTKSKCESKS